MLIEIDVLQPQQRERYLRWTFERHPRRSPRERSRLPEQP
jgi:hypothetical protein